VTGYFSDRAEDYARYRPSYPTEAVRTILAGLRMPVRSVDLGCGTGIASRLLAEAGAEVVGIEPNEAMLEEARRHGGGPEYRFGTAEASGLADASADLVVCAQSFHWFELEPTLRELQRILAAKGRLALVWNVRRTDTPFGEAYAKIVRRAQRATESGGRIVRANRSADPSSGGRFGDVRKLVFPNDVRFDREGLLGRAHSTSYFPLRGDLHDELVAELEALFEEHAREGEVVFPQRTEVTLATRL
jgi:SAM-dependent methyltransferase